MSKRHQHRRRDREYHRSRSAADEQKRELLENALGRFLAKNPDASHDSVHALYSGHKVEDSLQALISLLTVALSEAVQLCENARAAPIACAEPPTWTEGFTLKGEPDPDNPDDEYTITFDGETGELTFQPAEYQLKMARSDNTGTEYLPEA